MKPLKLILLIFIVSGQLVGCSASRQYSKTETHKAGSGQINNTSQSKDIRAKKSDKEKTERKILYTAYLTIAVEEPDSSNKMIEEIANKYGGYVNEIGTHRSVIRVKSNNFEPAISDIQKLGKVRSKRKTGKDVTDKYYDYKIRLENAREARNRYLELLKEAEDVEAVLKVEKELERLNEKIDRLKGKMNRINHLDKFSTININLKERKKPGVLGYIGIGIYHSVKWLFVRN